MEINLNNIIDAFRLIQPHINKTPVLTSGTLNYLTENQVFLKCENFQKTGAFKFRGACNSVFSLSENEAKKGVATHSSGNHAAALAKAAKMRGIDAHIVMPENSSPIKKKAVETYDGKITYCKPTLQAREETLEKIVAETGAIFIHPYNYEKTIAGQGTAAFEFLNEIPDLEIIIAPVGGGGLLSGTAIAAKNMKPSIKIIAAEPLNANDAFLSFYSGKFVPSENPKTIADGLLTSLGSITFPIIQQLVDDIVTLTEEAIIRAMQTVWERMKIIIEPSSAVVVAALLEHSIHLSNKKIGLIISGGNVDLEKYFENYKLKTK